MRGDSVTSAAHKRMSRPDDATDVARLASTSEIVDAATDAGGDAAWQQYLALCSAYLARQIIVYENWPQRRFSPTGYSDEKVFRDQNA